MNITYVGRHGQECSNDDEGAVVHALRSLGHTVFPMNEGEGHHAPKSRSRDLLLFNKWGDVGTLKACKGRFGKIAFWWWDLVDWPQDPTLAVRCKQRMDWMHRTMPLVDVGFCTDGDWVDRYPDKLVWLPQGADERVVGRGDPTCPHCGTQGQFHDILFTGISRGGGKVRESFVVEMTERYGKRFKHVSNGVHGRAMANLIAQSKIVVAPDSPVTDRYWSNRVYNMLGFGAFLLHPYCKELSNHYAFGTGRELGVYLDRKDLFRLIDIWLDYPDDRAEMSERSLKVTRDRHLYLHRCEQLLKVVFG